MMKLAQIQALLDRYFAGTSSLEEEAQLKAYFNSGKVAEEIQQFQPLFAYLKGAKEAELPAQFSGQLQATKTVRLQARSSRLRRWSMAASVALLMSLGIWYMLPSTTIIDTPNMAQVDWTEFEEEDPEVALEQTKAALRMLGAKLNGGAKKATKEVDKLGKLVNIGD